MKLIICIFIFCFPLIACAKVPVRDAELSALQGGDVTVLLEGCGSPLIVGYTYCRKYSGDASNESLAIVGPITNCKRDSCVEFKIFGPDGSLAYGDMIPKNRNRKLIPWSSLLKRGTFEELDRGFWFVVMRVYWNDADGRENISVGEGEIRLRVINKKYLPLHEVEADPNFAWAFRTLSGETVRITTGLRSYVSTRGASR